MATVVLLRHAHSVANEKNLLAGRMPGIHLSRKGQTQSHALVERIGKGVVDQVHLSPMQRCQLTIDPWLNSRNSSSITSLDVDERFNEVDYGDWSGRSLNALSRNPLWKQVQEQPSKVRFPGGESIRSSQKRIVAGIDEILGGKKNLTHLVVTHSDLIKVALTHYFESHIDTFQRIDISQASFTVITGTPSKFSIITTNSSSDLTSILGKR